MQLLCLQTQHFEVADARVQPTGIAVDFGGTKISAARVVDGVVQTHLKTRTDGNADVEAQLAAICELIDRLEVSDTDNVGIAVAGRVSGAGVWFALNTKTLSKVTEFPLQDRLSEILDRPVTVQNDATAAAIGEYRCGAGRGTTAFGFITVSTGIGGGLILEGKPVVSEMGLAGHVGFTTSRLAQHRCGSGRDRTVESIASGRALARYAADAGQPGLDGKAVYQAHLSGEAWARDLVCQSASAVAELCANLKTVLDLDRIALGGSIGLAEGYLDLVRAALKEEPEIFRPSVIHAALGADAALIGVLVR